MKNSKQYILETAFALFLEKGYDGVSISDLQKKLGMGRASLYHYFKGKKELFINVVEQCFLAQGKAKHLREIKNLSLSEMLVNNIKKHKEALSRHSASAGNNIGILNYYLLAFQAIKHCPDFKKQAKNLQENESEQWKSVIKNSIDNGELRSDINIEETAKLFINAENGIGIKSSYSTSIDKVISEIEKMYQFLFSLIKS